MTIRPFPATRALAEFCASFELSRATPLVLTRCKELLLDLVGVTIAASRDEAAHMLKDTLKDTAGAEAGGTATLIGMGCTGSPADAAFANAALAHCLEFDDSTLNPVGHPSCTILPALIGLCEAKQLSGAALLEAYLVGLEAHSRLGQAQKGNWTEGNWLPIGHISLVGAAAACARLLRLDAGHAGHALGLAAQFCGQLNVNSGSHAKPFGAGNSARAGVVAALLAQQGATAADAVIERAGGFADVFFGAGKHDLALALGKLGAPHHLEEIGIAIKRYPSCYGCHWGIDALVELLSEHAVVAGEISSLELAHPASGAFLDVPDPHTAEEAKFSHQYNLAVTVLDGIPDVDSFLPGRIQKPDVQAVLKRVSTRTHPADLPAPKSWEYLVTLNTNDGRRWQKSVPRPLGHPRRPMSRSEIEAKFRRCATPVLRAGDVDALIDVVDRIDRLDNLSSLTRLLRKVGT